MTIYDIENAILDCIDPETGEIDEERLTALEMERDQKFEGVACWFKELKAEAEAIRNEEFSLKKRREACENKAESLKKYLKYWLNGQKFKTPKVSISYRTSKAVEIAEGAFIPEEYRRVKWEPDKTALKDALDAGEEFDGIKMVEKQSVIIK